MYKINLMIIYDVVNIFSMKKLLLFKKTEGGRELVPGRELVHHHYQYCLSFSVFKAGDELDVVTSALLYLRVEPWHDPT